MITFETIRRATRGSALALLSAVLLAVSAPASSGVLFASGDSTPSFYPDTLAGNAQFFENILQGGTSVVTHDLLNTTFSANLNGFYNGLAGVTSTDAMNAVVDATLLSGVDLFITHLATDPFSASELAALGTFLAGSGTVMLMADAGQSQATRVDSALSGLGSGMSVANIGTTYDIGVQNATGSNIANDPFNTGVTSLRWGSTHEIAGGTPLYYMNSVRLPFMAYESTMAPPVSEPHLLGLMGFGIAAMGLMARRRRRRES